MPLFEPYDIETMNETDVREAIVRPLIRALGYTHGGAEARIETEKTFRYGKAFLGRKSPSKDPDLVGRADYICEVVSIGRWVVEVKSPAADLTLDDAEQAHTYTAHPEVAGWFFLLCNGREFRLYRANHPAEPAATWPVSETENMLPALHGILSPDGIRKIAGLKIDLSKPLARGFGPTVEIVGGFLTYERNRTTHALFAGELARMNGMRCPVTGGVFKRQDDGRISGTLEIENANSALDDLQDIMSVNLGLYFASDEFVSTNIESPTIFQNAFAVDLPAGTAVGGNSLSMLGGRLPFDVEARAKTEATGFIEGEYIRGVFTIDFEFQFTGMMLELARASGADFPERVTIISEGDFQARIR